MCGTGRTTHPKKVWKPVTFSLLGWKHGETGGLWQLGQTTCCCGLPCSWPSPAHVDCVLLWRSPPGELLPFGETYIGLGLGQPLENHWDFQSLPLLESGNFRTPWGHQGQEVGMWWQRRYSSSSPSCPRPRVGCGVAEKDRVHCWEVVQGF